jgi:hypothetical protein
MPGAGDTSELAWAYDEDATVASCEQGQGRPAGACIAGLGSRAVTTEGWNGSKGVKGSKIRGL